MSRLHLFCLIGLTWMAWGPGALVDASPLDQLEEAQRLLRSEEETKRQSAVETLASLGSEEGWTLVLTALGDESARVADEAQLQLASAGAEFDGLLFGKLGLGEKRGLSALRVAEALGRRASSPGGKTWERALKHKDVQVRRSLYWSLERLASRQESDRAELAQLLERGVQKDRDELARAHALLALVALDPIAASGLLVDLSSSDSSAMRAACAEGSAVLGDAQLELLERLVLDEERVVRLRAYESLARRSDRAGALALAIALGTESELRSSWRLVELLQNLSGRREGRNARGWKAWAESLPEDWAPGELRNEHEYGSERTASFVGMPLLSDRLAFLIDLSGSIWMEREGGTRKQAVDVELRRALEALPEGTLFNLYPFTTEPRRWMKSLTPASERSVEKALAEFEGNHSRGKGDYWAAMMLALDDPGVDTLVVLGDGAPSGGDRWNLRLMGPLFSHANRFRGVAVDALLIETKGRLRGYWEELTAHSGGRCLVVEL
jgi:hypothetical protein